MRQLLARLAFCAGALFSPIVAHACYLSMGKITVTSRQIEPDVNHSTAETELTDVAQLSRPGDADGITFVKFDSRIEVHDAGFQNGCPVADVSIELFAPTATVYIAREVPADSCRYGAVMDHELKHVQIAQRSLDATAEAFKRRLMDTESVPPFAEHRWGQVANTGDGYSLDNWLRDQTAMAIEYANGLFDKGNHELDVPAEGTRLQRMCAPAQAIIGQRRYNLE